MMEPDALPAQRFGYADLMDTQRAPGGRNRAEALQLMAARQKESERLQLLTSGDVVVKELNRKNNLKETTHAWKMALRMESKKKTPSTSSSMETAAGQNPQEERPSTVAEEKSRTLIRERRYMRHVRAAIKTEEPKLDEAVQVTKEESVMVTNPGTSTATGRQFDRSEMGSEKVLVSPGEDPSGPGMNSEAIVDEELLSLTKEARGIFKRRHFGRGLGRV